MIQTAHSPIRDRRPPLAREGAFGPGDSGAPFQVTQISTTDVRGGAARATLRLQRALGGAGVRSRMLVAQRFGDDADVVEFNSLAPAPRMLAQAFFRFGRRWHRPSIRRAGAYFTPDWSFTGWRLASQLPPSDLVNLHWVADLLDYRTLPRLTAQLPVVWTFHDMNAFTGGCHYCESCRRFQDRCGSCPLLMTSSGDEDMTRRILNRKQQVLGRVPPSRLAIVCPSEWLAAEALRSSFSGCLATDVTSTFISCSTLRLLSRSTVMVSVSARAGSAAMAEAATSAANGRAGTSERVFMGRRQTA